LKQALAVFHEAQARNDFMWEINHPFPYEDHKFISLYSSFLEFAPDRQRNAVWSIRRTLCELLSKVDYEYLVWQEWKEGFARWIENQIRARLDLPENQGGKSGPMNRVSFYAGGEKFIDLITEEDPSLAVDIETLFHRMLNLG
jgi:hypothetical protein